MPNGTRTNVQDVIQTALGVENILLGRRAQDERERQQLASRIALFQSVGAMVDRGRQAAIAGMLEEEGLAGGFDLDVLMEGTPLEPAAVRARAGEAGLAELPEEDRATAEREAAIREITGTGGVELALAGQVSRLGGEELMQAVRIGLGTGLTAAQTADTEIRNQGLQLNWLDLVQRGALGEADLATRMAIAEMDAQLGLARILAEGNEDINATAELQNFASIIRNLEANRTGMSNSSILAHLVSLRTVLQRLSEAGYPVPTDVFDEDISGLQGTGGGSFAGILPSIKNWFGRFVEGRQRQGSR